jgi:hypothetical protein
MRMKGRRATDGNHHVMLQGAANTEARARCATTTSGGLAGHQRKTHEPVLATWAIWQGNNRGEELPGLSGCPSMCVCGGGGMHKVQQLAGKNRRQLCKCWELTCGVEMCGRLMSRPGAVCMELDG